MADERVGLGREEALALVRARVLGYAFRRLSSAADAEDLTQETMVVLTTKYAHVSAPQELVAIGVVTLKKMRAGFLRKAKRRRELGDVPPPEREDGAPLDAPSDGPNPEEIARARQRASMYREAADQLSGRCRDLLRRRLEGQSSVEIAAELGRPENTVYSWEYRCRERLKALLAENWAYVIGEAS